MRDAVRTWTTASTAAAVANHALNAIGDEKTVVTASRYVLVASRSGPIPRPWLECGPEHTPSPPGLSLRPWDG